MEDQSRDNMVDISSFRRDTEEFEEKFYNMISSGTSIIYKAKQMSGIYENHKTSEFKDINNMLSEYAQSAVQDVKGPLKPDNLFKLLLNVIFQNQVKNIMTTIREYSDDISGVRRQLAEVLDKVQKYIEYRKIQNTLDTKFIAKVKKFDGSIEKEEEKEKKLNAKLTKVSAMKEKKQMNGTIANKNEKTKKLIIQDPPVSSNPVTPGQQSNKKRKFNVGSGDSSGLTRNMSNGKKRLQNNSPGKSIKPMPIDSLAGSSRQNTDDLDYSDLEHSDLDDGFGDMVELYDNVEHTGKRKSSRFIRTISERAEPTLEESTATESDDDDETGTEQRPFPRVSRKN